MDPPARDLVTIDQRDFSNIIVCVPKQATNLGTRIMDVNPMTTALSVEPNDPSYPKALADYCTQQFLVQEGQVLQVYEELVNLA
jgi:hypothetical protein